MSSHQIKALTFDTGGTILDWHSGFLSALKFAGEKYGIKKNWGQITNELRRRSLMSMLNLGEYLPPQYNFDDAHQFTLEALLRENHIHEFSKDDIHEIAYKTPHNFKCWPDFPKVIPILKKHYIVSSFTILSYRLIIDTAKNNGFSWDSVFSCEGIGKYKILPESYKTVSSYLQLKVEECCMVACHNFDLNAAKSVGYKTAFIRRPDEWGFESPPDPEPNPEHDIIVDTFSELVEALDVLNKKI